MDYTKVGNRYYKVETRDEVDCVVKATYNEEDDVYVECGCWGVEEFNAHATTMDGNTEEEYDNIVSELSI